MQSPFISRVCRALAAPDVAIDLGTANTRLYAQGRGLLADEPSLVRIHKDTGAIDAVGFEAVQQRATRARLIAPLRAGVVADVDAASELLTPLLQRAKRFGFLRPRVLACAPTDACEQERDALVEATRRAGAAAVVLVPEPMAAAIGMGMDVGAPYAQMLVDIGDGVTDVAVIRSGELIATAAVRTACSDLTQLVAERIAEEQQINIYRGEVQRLVQRIGSGQNAEARYVVAGADLQTGLQRRVFVNTQDLATVLQPALRTITKLVANTFRGLSDEMACEVIENGIRLTGGGAYVNGMADLLAHETALSVRLARNPMHSVINGARQMLQVGIQTNIWQTEIRQA